MAPFTPTPPCAQTSSLPSIHAPSLPQPHQTPYPDIPLSSLRGYTPPDQPFYPSHQPSQTHPYSSENRILPRHPYLHSRSSVPKPLNSPLVTTNTSRYRQPPFHSYQQHHYHFQHTQPPQPQLQRAIDLDVFGTIPSSTHHAPPDILSSHPTTLTPFSHPTSRSMPSYASASPDIPFSSQLSAQTPHNSCHPFAAPASDLVPTSIDYDLPHRQDTNLSDLANLPSLNFLPSSQQPIDSSAAAAAAAAAAMSLSNSNLLAPFQSQQPPSVDLTSVTRVPDMSAAAVSQVPDLMDPHAPDLTGIPTSSQNAIFDSVPSATPMTEDDAAVRSMQPLEPVRPLGMSPFPSHFEPPRPLIPESAQVNPALTPVQKMEDHAVAAPADASVGVDSGLALETKTNVPQRNVSSRSSTNVTEDAAHIGVGRVTTATMATGPWQTQNLTLAGTHNSNVFEGQDNTTQGHGSLNNNMEMHGEVTLGCVKVRGEVEAEKETGPSEGVHEKEMAEIEASRDETGSTAPQAVNDTSVDELRCNAETRERLQGEESTEKAGEVAMFGTGQQSSQDKDSEVTRKGLASQEIAECHTREAMTSEEARIESQIAKGSQSGAELEKSSEGTGDCRPTDMGDGGYANKAILSNSSSCSGGEPAVTDLRIDGVKTVKGGVVSEARQSHGPQACGGDKKVGCANAPSTARECSFGMMSQAWESTAWSGQKDEQAGGDEDVRNVAVSGDLAVTRRMESETTRALEVSLTPVKRNVQSDRNGWTTDVGLKDSAEGTKQPKDEAPATEKRVEKEVGDVDSKGNGRPERDNKGDVLITKEERAGVDATGQERLRHEENGEVGEQASDGKIGCESAMADVDEVGREDEAQGGEAKRDKVGEKRKRGVEGGVETRMTRKRRRNAELSTKAEVGDEVSVYWEDDRQFYDGMIQEKTAEGKFRIVYFDGDVELLDLSDPKETWRFITKGKE